MMDRTLPLNEAQAETVLRGVSDAAIQNLLRLALANARMEFMRRTDQSESEWLAQLPASPFDMAFFIRVLAKAFARPDLIRQILDGASLAEASGWKTE